MLSAIALCLTSIHDGDSVRLCDGTRVRLVSAHGAIDAPELRGSPSCGPRARGRHNCDYVAGEAARAALVRFLAGSGTIDCRGFDQYHRSLCTIRVNGRDVGDAMVAGGYAVRREW